MQTELEVHEVSELRLLAERGELPERLEPCGLLAAVHLACSAWFWQRYSNPAFTVFQGWLSDPRLAAAWGAMTSLRTVGVDYSAKPLELLTVTDTIAEAQFANRFRKSLEELGGFSQAEARGLAGSLQELIDNVRQHSGPTDQAAAAGIMGYEVSTQSFAFAVGDVGRGTLASLRENPAWAQLPDEAAALAAIIKRNASRRLDNTPGSGFRDAVRVLSDFGRLSVGSGDAYLDVVGTPTGRTASGGHRFALPGVQVGVFGRRLP
jgi:hypothetical protein